MNIAWIWLPVLFQILLTVVMFVRLAVVKARAFKNGEVDRKRTALHADAWPPQVILVNNNIANQFQIPVLFYVLVVSAVAFGAVNTASVALAWLFVASRFAHAYVHTSSNYVPLRMRFFIVGVLAVFGLLVVTARAVVLAI